MIIENKYVLVINDLSECIIHAFIKSAKIETKSNIIVAKELSELDINLIPILKDLKDAKINNIYNYKGKIICNSDLK